MTTILAILITLLGTTIGSFLSVVLYRLKTKTKGIVLSRSICPNCKKTLKWIHLIPILSYVFLKGKCAFCGKKISIKYFLLELCTGLLFLVAYLNWNFIEGIPSTVDPALLSYTINVDILALFLFYIIEFTLLIAIFFYDLLYKEIPDSLSIPAIAIAFTGGLVFGINGLTEMVVGGAALFAFFGLQYLISRGKWIGGGDLRLGALMGILLGWEKGLLALIIAYVLGSIFAIPLLIKGTVKKNSEIAFGPFLIIATLAVIFFGNDILSWYFNFLTN